MWHFFQMKIVENSRSKPAETSCPGTTFSDNHQKNSLIPSAVKFVEWNTEAAIFFECRLLKIWNYRPICTGS